MKVIKEEKFNKLMADEGMHIRSVNDEYRPEHEEEGHIVPEHFPYYTTLVYLPLSLTEEQILEMYVEEPIK